MSRTRPARHAHRRGFPRVSGDEPREIEALLDPEQFSPRERG